MELVGELVKKLGISEDAAKGGAGLMFKVVQDKLGAGDFSKIAAVVPGINDLIGSSPESGGIMGGLGNLASGLGGAAANIGTLGRLTSGFSKLGLDAGMIGRFLSVIVSFVESQKGGSAAKALLEKVLG